MKDFSEVRERVERLNIIDDTLFQKMSEDIGFCEEMFSTIMKENIKVVQEQFPNTSIRKEKLKKSREGVEIMCDIVEEYAKEYAKEYAEKQSLIAVRQVEEKLAKKLLEEGMTIEKIVSMMEMLSAEDVKKISGEA